MAGVVKLAFVVKTKFSRGFSVISRAIFVSVATEVVFVGISVVLVVVGKGVVVVVVKLVRLSRKAEKKNYIGF